MNEQDYEQLTLYPADSPVNHFPLPGSAEAQKTTVTSGQKCAELLQSCNPLGLLGKMLLESSIWRSTQCYLTWKPKATPQGRLLFQLVASAPRTDDTGQQLWLTTPTAQESSAGRSKKFLGKNKTPTPNEFVRLWPTVRSQESGDYQYSKGNHNKKTLTLSGAVKLWPTPTAQDGKNSTLPISQIKRDSVPGAVLRSLYPTPTAADAEGSSGGKMHSSLRTEAGGQLNPEWVEWLMGFPIGWTELDV